MPGFEIGEICNAWGRKGEIFDRFSLKLPVGSQVIREEDGSILIDSPYIALKFRAEFQGFSALIPSTFVEHYMGIAWEDQLAPMRSDKGKQEHARTLRVLDIMSPFLVRLFVNARIKRKAFLRGNVRHELIAWAESFMFAIRERVSRDHFFRQINWPLIEAWLRVAQNPQGPKASAEI